MSAAEGETQIPAGVAHLWQDGVLDWKHGRGWDAAEVERLVGEYGPLIKEVNLL